MEGNPSSQSTERLVNSAGSQTITSLRDEEVLGERKLQLSALIAGPQGGQGGRMQRHQAGFPEFAFPNDQ
jgi:hypothetical protein